MSVAVFYLGARVYRYAAIMLYSILGNQTARYTGICWAKADEIAWNNMYEKLKPRPIPSERPIPPFVFFDDNEPNLIAAKELEKKYNIKVQTVKV